MQSGKGQRKKAGKGRKDEIESEYEQNMKNSQGRGLGGR